MTRSPVDFSCAAILSLPFAAYLAVISRLRPPTPENWARADPILALLPRAAVGVVPLFAVAVAWVWVRQSRPDRVALARAGRHALLGVAVALALTVCLRVVAGSQLPSFVPAEENAGPGVALSMTAGYLEELVCRLVLLPVLFFSLPRKTGSIALAALVVGLFFAAWHALSPTDPGLARYFVARLVLPGVAFTVAALVVSPTFLVTAHAAAHLALPLLFS